MIILSMIRYKEKTPCQQTVIDFCNMYHNKWTIAMWDDKGKCVFSPDIKKLPNWNWVWVNLGNTKFPGKFIVEPTYMWTQTKPTGYHLNIHSTAKTQFVLETPWIQVFDLDEDEEIIPTKLIKLLLNASNLPHYGTKYDTKNKFVDKGIPEEWVCVEELSEVNGVNDGGIYVRMPKEFYSFLDPKDFPSLSTL